MTKSEYKEKLDKLITEFIIGKITKAELIASIIFAGELKEGKQ